MEFGKILYTLRKKHGLSQKQLANDLNVAQASINYWEKGERTPSIDAAKKIADYFGISVDDLVNGIIEQSVVSLNKTFNFYDYLGSLGYELGESDIEHYKMQMHIIDSDTYVYLTDSDMEILEELESETESNIKRTIGLLIATKKN